jgi:predicted metalloprotease with PDZ domain
MSSTTRPSLAVSRFAALVMALAPAALSAYGQATIRSRDVVNDWSTASSPAPALLPGTSSPSWNQQPNAWRLGVAIENLETGVLLTDVERSLPADSAGLKRGDVIISVGGYQVGYVDGALFDLGDELRRRADAQGRVTFLIFDGRTRQLRSLPIQLQQQASTGVRGQVV